MTKLTIANNLTLVVSILWSFYHACLFAAPVYWALVFNPTRSKFALGLGSYVLWFLAWACMALVAIACIGLGTADRLHFKVSRGLLQRASLTPSQLCCACRPDKPAPPLCRCQCLHCSSIAVSWHDELTQRS